MPKGLVRYQQCGCFHFITFGCYHRFEHLGTAAARELFEHSLETLRLRYGFVVYGYVVMPDHVHLLVSEPKKALLSKAIQALKLSVSVQSKERPFWQPRYYDFNVLNEEKRQLLSSAGVVGAGRSVQRLRAGVRCRACAVWLCRSRIRVDAGARSSAGWGATPVVAVGCASGVEATDLAQAERTWRGSVLAASLLRFHRA